MTGQRPRRVWSALDGPVSQQSHAIVSCGLCGWGGSPFLLRRCPYCWVPVALPFAGWLRALPCGVCRSCSWVAAAASRFCLVCLWVAALPVAALALVFASLACFTSGAPGFDLGGSEPPRPPYMFRDTAEYDSCQAPSCPLDQHVRCLGCCCCLSGFR